jgi:integrase/recombinase XerD
VSGVTIDGYLAYLRDVRRMSPNTVESYARDLAALAAFAEKGQLDPAALDRRDLEAFVRSQMASGLSPRSTARAVACVRGFYKFLAVEQRRESSPADDLRAPRAWAALPKFLDLDEVDRLLAQPDVSKPRGLRDKALISVLYATGLRVSELISLRLPNLHLQEGYLTCIGKGDKERIVPIGQEATDWVRRYLADARPKLAPKSSPWLFVNARGGPLSRVGFWKLLKPISGPSR